MAASPGSDQDTAASPNPDYDIDDDGDVDMADDSDDSDYVDSTDHSNSDSNSPEPSKPVKPWHENKKIIQLIGLNTLNDRGYINLDTIDVDADFGWAPQRQHPAASFRNSMVTTPGPVSSMLAANTATNKADRIHPIFRRSRWQNNEAIDKDYGLLEPTLQLATLLLEDENTTSYLIGLLDTDRHRRIFNGEAEKRIEQKLYWFQARANPSNQQQQELWTTLRNLTACVQWAVSPPNKKCSNHGLTIAEPNTPGLSYKGVNVVIRLHWEYIWTLTNRLSVDSVATNWVPGTDAASARLRTSLLLAITMVHEVTHALWYATHGWELEEPFYLDTRTAEVGFQWEKKLFGGETVSIVRSNTCPYGICTMRWPGPGPLGPDPPIRYMGLPDPEIVLTSAKKWGFPDWQTQYCIEMSWVQGFFTNNFWDEVDRFGLSNLQPARRLGVRNFDKLVFWDNESPTQRAAKSPISSKDDHVNEDPNGVVIDKGIM